MLVNTEYFSEEAKRFLRTGYYTQDPVGSTLWKEYWSEQLKRCIEGYEVGGLRITGDHYFYLNFCQIRLTEDTYGNVSKKKTARKVTSFPAFWDGDYNFFHVKEIARHGIDPADLKKLKLDVDISPAHLDGGHHVIVGKARRKGYSYKNGAIVVNTYNSKRRSLCLIGAFEKKYLYPKGTMQMVTDYMNFLNEHTAFAKRRGVVDKQDHRRASFLEFAPNGSKIEKGYLSEVIAISFKDNADASRGKDADLVLFEEAGKFDNLKASYLATKPVVEDGGMTTGQMIVFGCVCAGTKVWTHDGRYIEIEKLRQEDGIVGYGGKFATLEPIVWMKPPAEKPCYRITTEKGNIIECSDDHPLMVSLNGFTKWTSGQPNRKKVTFKRADQIKPGDQLMSVRQVPIFGKKRMWKPRLIGLLTGDGYYGKNATPQLSVEGDDIYNWVKKEFNGNITVNKQWTTKSGLQFRDISIKGIINELKQVGIYAQTWENKQVPDNIHECDLYSIAEFVGGYFDADGNVYHNKKKKSLRISLTSKYPHLLEGVKMLLYKLNVGCQIVEENRRSGYKPGKIYRLYINKQKDIKEFKKHVKLISSHKQKAIDEYVSHCKGRYSYDNCYFEFNPDTPKGTYYLKEGNNQLDNLESNYVKSVEFIGNKPVYNLNAGITHTYITNGFVSGNTGGDMEGGTIDFESMFYNPEPYNLLPIENQWDEGGHGTFCGFFVPSYINKPGFIDKHGNSLIKEAKESEEAIRETIKRTSKDPGTYDKHITEYPFSGKEAFLQSGNNIFPLSSIVEHKNYLNRSNATMFMGVVGALSRDGKGKVQFRPDDSLRPVIKFPHDNKADNSGAVVIYQSPYKQDGEVPQNMYFLCHDPYDHDGTSGSSLGAAYVIKRPNNISQPDDMIVASYIGRPSTQDEYNSNLFMLAELYNCRIGFENDRGDVIGYAKRFRLLDSLEEEFELSYNSNLPKSGVRRGYGMHMTEARKRQGELYLRDWLLQTRSIDEKGNKMLNLHSIYDVALLDELRTYNPNKGNFDRVSAMLIGMYYMKEIEFKQLAVQVKEEKPLTSLFERELF